MSATAASAVITITQTLDYTAANANSLLLNQYNVAGSTLTNVVFTWRPNPIASSVTVVSTSGNNRTFVATATLTSSLSNSAFTTITASQTATTGSFAVNGKVTVTAALSQLSPSFLNPNAPITTSFGPSAFAGSGTLAILNSIALTNLAVTPTGGMGNFRSSSNARNGGVLVVTYTGTDVSPFPEPASWILMIVGFGGTGALMRRQRRITA